MAKDISLCQRKEEKVSEDRAGEAEGTDGLQLGPQASRVAGSVTGLCSVTASAALASEAGALELLLS